MVVSVLTCLSFIFFLPYFSNSYTPSLPCNPSIEIKPPFYHQSDITIDHNCLGYLPIECYNKTSFLLWLPNKPLQLESISYDNNTITVQNPDLSSSLKKSGCRNLYFNFSGPINFYPGLYCSLNSSLSSLRCDPPDHIQSVPKIFRKDYNLSYSPSFGKDDKPSQNCSRPDNSLHRSFESIFSFKNDSSRLTLLSASYSDDLVARPGCFANWTEVFDPKDGKG